VREIQVHPPSKRRPPEVIGRLQFSADGGELVACVGAVLHAYDLRTDTARVLFDLSDWNGGYVPGPDLLVSPDRRFAACAYYVDRDASVYFEELPDPNHERGWLPDVPGESVGYLGLMFTANGKELIAVRNRWNVAHGPMVPDVARFELAALTEPPKRFRQGRNPFTGAPMQVAVRNLKWKCVLDLPDDAAPSAAALSANGRLVAAGTVDGSVHVADLKKKQVLASFGWSGRVLRDRQVTRVGFDPKGEWVASIAGGRLFARPLGEGKAWWTKDTLGRVTDFAYHPDGRVLCAVFADGQARFLDPRTGAVRESFKWAKRPRPLHSVAFAPDGLTCAVGAENGKVVVWDVDL
jgi:YD repeat-containing protein